MKVCAAHTTRAWGEPTESGNRLNFEAAFHDWRLVITSDSDLSNLQDWRIGFCTNSWNTSSGSQGMREGVILTVGPCFEHIYIPLRTTLSSL